MALAYLAGLRARRSGSSCSTPWATRSAGPPTSRPCAPRCARRPRGCAPTASAASRPTRCASSTARSRRTRPIIEALPRISDHLCAGLPRPLRGGAARARPARHPLPAEPPPGARPRLLRAHDLRGAERATSASQNSVLGGGRYDGLVKELGGPDISGIGFALGMERLVMTIPPRGGGAALRRCSWPRSPRARSTTPCACSASCARPGVARAHGPRGPRPQVADEARGQAGRALRGHPGRGRAGHGSAWTVRDMKDSTQEARGPRRAPVRRRSSRRTTRWLTRWATSPAPTTAGRCAAPTWGRR